MLDKYWFTGEAHNKIVLGAHKSEPTKERLKEYAKDYEIGVKNLEVISVFLQE